jgi:membrane dipeptidase
MKVFDLHCDTLMTEAPLAGNIGSVDLDRLPQNMQYCQCFAIFIKDCLPQAQAWQQLMRYMQHFSWQMQSYAALISHCRSTVEIEKAFQNGQAAAILTIENGTALAGNLDNLFLFAQHGVKAMSLTWNGTNLLGGGALSQQGLTPFGRSVIRQMEGLRMIVDVSHLNDQTFWQVAEFANKPVMASHSNSRAVCHHPRNLTDQQFRWIIEQGGLCGINYCVDFLSQSHPTGYNTLLHHIDHLLELGGENTIALGSDFDGSTTPEFLSSIKDLGSFYDYLCACGYNKTLVDKLFFYNAFEFFKQFDP